MAVTLTYTLPAAPAVAVPSPITQLDLLFGRDLWFDVRQGASANYETTPAGDWKIVEGREALRQAILRRIITDPGEWATLPGYGVGARMYVKARNTRATRDELVERIRGQVLQDPRVESVEAVQVEILPDKVRIGVIVVPLGRTQRNEVVRASVEVT